jgi:threonine/homoserine/homoserine lactone efflux protein
VNDVLSGVVFGLAAGLTPGPLLTLVIQQTLRHGPTEGIKVAAAPSLTDLPIVAAALFAVNRVADADPVLGAMSLAGAAFLAYLAYESVTTDVVAPDGPVPTARSLHKGVTANLLNPHPYLFWLTIGAPILWQAWATRPVNAAGFLGAMYLCLVGSKMLLAVMVGRGRSVLTSRAYRLLVRALGCALLVFAVLFLRDGLRYLSLD